MRRTGFTLIELLVVVIILGVLTAIALPQYRKAIDRSKVAEAMQMLPAIFEARERWMIENQCTWSNGSAVCQNNQTPTFGKLDIEAKGSGTGSTLTTSYFTYTLTSASGANQPFVIAKPVWGSNRGITGATIYYRGDKFCCSGGTVCEALNIETTDECK